MVVKCQHPRMKNVALDLCTVRQTCQDCGWKIDYDPVMRKVIREGMLPPWVDNLPAVGKQDTSISFYPHTMDEVVTALAREPKKCGRPRLGEYRSCLDCGKEIYVRQSYASRGPQYGLRCGGCSHNPRGPLKKEEPMVYVDFEDRKEEIVASFARTGNMKTVSKELNIPHTTIYHLLIKWELWTPHKRKKKILGKGGYNLPKHLEYENRKDEILKVVGEHATIAAAGKALVIPGTSVHSLLKRWKVEAGVLRAETDRLKTPQEKAQRLFRGLDDLVAKGIEWKSVVLEIYRSSDEMLPDGNLFKKWLRGLIRGFQISGELE